MLLAHLSHLGLATPDPERTQRFYEDHLGLTEAERLGDGRVRLGWGQGHHVLEISEGNGLDHFAFEVEDPALETLEARLRATGATDWTEPDGDHPRALVCHDPDGNRLELHGRVDRSGERTADTARRPIRVQHITLGTLDVPRSVAFYTSLLGFRVSDHMGDRFTWMRSDAIHHTLAVVAADTPGLDHYSYDLGEWSDFKTWCDDLSERGVPVTWGPGRHGPGNNLFIFFDDLAGNRVELSAELERFRDDRVDYREPRVWEVSDRSINLWGALPPWRAEGRAFAPGAAPAAD